VSRARFESKRMQASTAYRMTVYRHQITRSDRTRSQLPSGKTESAPPACTCKLLKLKRLNVLESEQAAPSHPGAPHPYLLAASESHPLSLDSRAGKS
jgi:hypothetical protein